MDQDFCFCSLSLLQATMKHLKTTCQKPEHRVRVCNRHFALGNPVPGGQVLPMTQKGLRANFNLPLQPRYRQQQPAAQILTKYSTPNTTMVTISCKGDNAVSRESSVMESTLQIQLQTHNLRSAHLSEHITEPPAPINAEPRLARSSDLCCCAFPHPPLGW